MRAIFLLLPILLFAANVNVTVNKKTLNAGEELIVTISAEGKNIKFPNIQEIDGNTVVGVTNSENISIINGEMKSTVTKSFILYPQKSLTVPSFNVIINGKTFHTKPIKIKVVEPKQTKGNFELDINVSKNNLFLGENAVLTLKFIKKANANSIQIQRPYIKNFLIKEINSKEIKKPDEDITIYKFLIIPQKTGKYKIGPFIAQIGRLVKTQESDFLGFAIASMKYQNIYSNSLKINVKPIPADTIYGDFNISIKAHKEVEANTPNKVEVKISGCGDFYSIKPFNLNIKNATVYTEKPKLDLMIKNNKICGNFIQNFTVLANSGYIIPSLKLNTFDGKIHTVSTPEIKVRIKNLFQKTISINHPQNTLPKETKSKIDIKTILLISLISLVVGLLIGIIIFKLYMTLKTSEIMKIKKANEKELLNILKKYEENDKIKEIMQKIEENIYKNAGNKINKKEIIKLIKSIRKENERHTA